MASNNEAKIKFTAETSDFTQAISDANREMSSLKAEMKLADATFKNTGDSAQYQQQKLDLLQQALEANHDKQEALTGKLEAAKEIYGEDSKEVQTLEKQLTNAKTEEQNLLNQVNETNGGLDEQKDSAENAGTAVDEMASILVNAEVAGKVKEIAEAALEMAQNFDEAKAAIVEGTGASGTGLANLEKAAQGAFGEIADADTDLQTVSGTLAELNTHFGLTGDDAKDMTVKMSKFAKATGTDGTKAVDSMADIMKRWNLDLDDADDLLDDLTTANQSCQLSVDDLTGYLSGNSTQFQELGYSTEEALAMLISLSDGGADVGTVMSGLTKGVANLSDVTDDVPGTFRKAIDSIGKCDSVSEALQTQVGDTGKTVEQIFGKKAAQELATNVLNGSFAIEEWTAVLEDNDGALETTSEGVTTMKDTWAQACNNVSMALGSTMAPAISNVVKKVADVITKVAQVVQNSPVLQAVITGVATALGVLAAALAISSVIQAVTKAFGLLNTTMLANPIFLVVTALAALAASLTYAYNHCETFRNIVNKAFEAMKTVVMPIIDTIKTAVVNAFERIKAFVQEVMPQIKETISTVWNTVKTVVAGVANTIKSIVFTVFNAVKTFITTNQQTIKTIVSTVWNSIKTVVAAVVNGIKTVITTVWNSIKTTVSTVLSGIKTVVTTAWNGIKTSVSTAVNGIKTTVNTGFNVVKTTASKVWNSVKTATITAWNGIKTAITTPINSAKTLVSAAVNGIKTTVSTAFNSVKTTATTVWNGVKTAILTPINSAKTSISTALSNIKNLFSNCIPKLSLKLPHIKVDGGQAPWGIAGKGRLPSFKVEWNKLGAIFDKPTIFATRMGFQGVGEAGPEAVAPISTLQEYVQEAVEAGSTVIDYDHLADKVAAACARMNISINIDNRTLGRVVREMV